MINKNIIKVSLLILLLGTSVYAQTMSLDETINRLGGAGSVEFRWDPFFSSGTFINGSHEASFISGRAGESGSVLLDRRDVINVPLPFLDNGNIRFPEAFVNQITNTFVRHDDVIGDYRVGAIVIDPGHGGVDPGTVWEYTVNGRNMRIMEKDIVLRVSRMLHASLRAAFPDRQVVLTRDGDYNLTLEQRTDVANSLSLKENEIAIFISIHANSSFNRNARGFEVFYLDPSHQRELVDRSLHVGFEDVIPIINWLLEEEIGQESIILANSMLRRLEDAVGDVSPNRGLKSHNWFVVRNALMPAVLVELGFVSNREEALLLNDEAYFMKLSDALYKGIMDFIAFFERTGGSVTIQ